MHRGVNKITFKPLKGGDFRCNKTGERVKGAQVKSYRLREEQKLYDGIKKIKTRGYRVINLDEKYNAQCPHCHAWITARPGKTKCSSCGRKLWAQKPNLLTIRMPKRNSFTEVHCPYCQKEIFWLSIGEKQCNSCKKYFVITAN